MHIIINKLTELRPVLLVEAANVASVNFGEFGFSHGNCSSLSSSSRDTEEGGVAIDVLFFGFLTVRQRLETLINPISIEKTLSEIILEKFDQLVLLFLEISKAAEKQVHRINSVQLNSRSD
jgi:hypothetical protein